MYLLQPQMCQKGISVWEGLSVTEQLGGRTLEDGWPGPGACPYPEAPMRDLSSLEEAGMPSGHETSSACVSLGCGSVCCHTETPSLGV